MVKTKKRSSPRKAVGGIPIKNLTALDHFSVIARTAVLVDISSSGLLLHVDRKSLIPKSLRENLTLEALHGERVMLQIRDMDLEIDGTVSRTRMIGKGVYELAVDFSAQAPEYWRECLVELMPEPGEID